MTPKQEAEGSNDRNEDAGGSEIADGSNYRVSDASGAAIADGSNYRDDDAEGSETADGSNYRVTDEPGWSLTVRTTATSRRSRQFMWKRRYALREWLAWRY